MKRLLLFPMLLMSVIALAGSGACPVTVNCDLDDAVMVQVRTEVSGTTVIGVYQHTIADGHVHQKLVRCN